MNLYITRDPDGILKIHTTKPKLVEGHWYNIGDWALVDPDYTWKLLPELTYENSPQRIEVKFIK